VNRGRTFLQHGDLAPAIGLLELAIDADPSNAEAYELRARAYAAVGEYDRAKTDFANAKELGYRGAWLVTIPQPQESEQESSASSVSLPLKVGRMIIEASPSGAASRAKSYYEQGRTSYGKHDFDAAIKYYDAASSADTSCAPTYNDRGVARAEKGDLDKAIADFTDAIGLNPRFKMAYMNRGRAYERSG
jgi:tetratricopeptide (TPR) repeat protein